VRCIPSTIGRVAARLGPAESGGFTRSRSLSIAEAIPGAALARTAKIDTVYGRRVIRFRRAGTRTLNVNLTRRGRRAVARRRRLGLIVSALRNPDRSQLVDAGFR
jgi:hypothetical protein